MDFSTNRHTDLSFEEILQTISMTEIEHFDIRTVTMGINLRDCAGGSVGEVSRRIYEKIVRCARNHVSLADQVEEQYGVSIVNKRIAVTPVAVMCDSFDRSGMIEIAHSLDRAARELGVDFLGGFSALVQKGFSHGDRALIDAIPEALAATERVCGSVNVASTRAGINMDAVARMGEVIVDAAQRSADKDGLACAKLVTFCNAVEDNPFMAGAFHGVSEPDCVLNVGISGPGVVLETVKKYPDMNLQDLAEVIKKLAFNMTRVGELFGRKLSKALGVPFGIIDLSLAPTPEPGDSVGAILEAIGLEKVGAPGSTAALAFLTDAVKKGGMMASSHIGGMSGAFIPVSEDHTMIQRARTNDISIEKLEAMTSVCSVGLDMVAVPGDTPATTISAIIADECAIGMMNNKTTGVRIIPVPGKKVGQEAVFGGLLGTAPVMPVREISSAQFIRRGGILPAPVTGITN
ncbi:PFL family protein [candidate division KSB1 bacterium]